MKFEVINVFLPEEEADKAREEALLKLYYYFKDKA